MKVIAMIPARYSASRFPGKLMQDLEGASVIVRTFKATVATKLFSEVYVVTDSEIISQEIKSIGGDVIMSGKVIATEGEIGGFNVSGSRLLSTKIGVGDGGATVSSSVFMTPSIGLNAPLPAMGLHAKSGSLGSGATVTVTLFVLVSLQPSP